LYPVSHDRRRDADVLADTGWTKRKKVRWPDAASDELLASPQVLNGYDTDLATGQNRLISRLRGSFDGNRPALDRAEGARLHQPGIRRSAGHLPNLDRALRAGKAQIGRTVKARSPPSWLPRT
jgi:hypothetical protein